MPTIKALVLEKVGQRITVLTEKGEFKKYYHSQDVEVGEMVVKWQLLTIAIYIILGLVLFALAVFMFNILLGSS